jgi:hypothetical protein
MFPSDLLAQRADEARLIRCSRLLSPCAMTILLSGMVVNSRETTAYGIWTGQIRAKLVTGANPGLE